MQSRRQFISLAVSPPRYLLSSKNSQTHNFIENISRVSRRLFVILFFFLLFFSSTSHTQRGKWQRGSRRSTCRCHDEESTVLILPSSSLLYSAFSFSSSFCRLLNRFSSFGSGSRITSTRARARVYTLLYFNARKRARAGEDYNSVGLTARIRRCRALWRITRRRPSVFCACDNAPHYSRETKLLPSIGILRMIVRIKFHTPSQSARTEGYFAGNYFETLRPNLYIKTQ